MRLVLDTSSITSAARNPSGASAVLTEFGLRRQFVWLMSVPLIFEYEDVLLRPEQLESSGLSVRQVDELLMAILNKTEQIQLGSFWGPSSVDRDDDHVLRLALFGRADAIVTFNTRHFATPARLLGVDLYTPAEALRALRSQHG